MPFDGSSRTHIHVAPPLTRDDYFELLNTTGRALRDDKKGFILSKIAEFFQCQKIKPHEWPEHVKHFSRRCRHRVEYVARIEA